MAKAKFARGSQAAYNALKNSNQLDADTIYTCKDSGNIYLGTYLLFESDAFKQVSISGKTVTFTTHGQFGVTGTKTLDLSAFATTEEVAAAISSVYKPAGSLAKSGIVSSLFIADNEGKVYNITEEFTVGTGEGEVSPTLFVDAAAGNTYPAGTNIVIINTAASGQSAVYKFDVLTGFIDLSGYKTKQNAVADPTPTEQGAGDTLYMIDTISQNENGVITPTKKKVYTKTSYNPSTNKLVTEADVDAAITWIELTEPSPS